METPYLVNIVISKCTLQTAHIKVSNMALFQLEIYLECKLLTASCVGDGIKSASIDTLSLDKIAISNCALQTSHIKGCPLVSFSRCFSIPRKDLS